jgi:uncharacterized protein
VGTVFDIAGVQEVFTRVVYPTGGQTVNTGERKERRGFASMSPEKQREIASKGGRAAHEKGTAHEWTADEARNAGRKGGQVSRGGRGRLVVPPQPISSPDENNQQ